jgi:hypothetical protein
MEYVRGDNSLPVNPGACLRNSNTSHGNKRKAPEEAPVFWKQDQLRHGLFGRIVYRAQEPVHPP